MSVYIPAKDEWVCGYGGRSNHKTVKVTTGAIGTHRSTFACGSHSDFVPFGYNPHKPRCKKCEKVEMKEAQHEAH